MALIDYIRGPWPLRGYECYNSSAAKAVPSLLSGTCMKNLLPWVGVGMEGSVKTRPGVWVFVAFTPSI